MLRSALRSCVLTLGMTSALCGAAQSSAGAAVFTNFSLPTIAGQAVEGQTLTEEHARWSSPPAAYAYQWQRCNSSGADCSSIPKARAQSYRLTAADVGFRIRVGESAQDAEGAVTPSMSEPTEVVQAAGADKQGGGGSNGGSSGGGGASGGGGSPVTHEQPTHAGTAEIKTLLLGQLAPSGKYASIAALLKHGSLRAGFKLPNAGSLVVRWYLAPPGGKRELIAVGQANLTAGETIAVKIELTALGRRLLERAHRPKLEATATFTPKGGAPIAATRSLSLKR
jgi:hypothetical protein